MDQKVLTNRVFKDDVHQPKVYVAGGQGAYGNTSTALEKVDLSPARGKRVLLKPNVGRIAPLGSGIVTNPHVVAAVADAFLKVGAEVAIGESPIAGVKTLEAFESAGITEMATERNIPLIDMDARRFVPLPVPDGKAIEQLKICPEVLEYDIIVSIPVMKMHMHTGATLAIKNMKGCLWRRSKVDLHMLPPVEGYEDKSLDIAISDMTSVLRPQLSVIDGTVGMEGLGPSAGTAKSLDVVVVGVDAFATDAVACQLMGIHAEEIPHLRLGAQRGFGMIDLLKIDVSPENWKDRASPFLKPPCDLSLEFPNIEILDKQSCSACQSTLLLFLQRYGDKIFEYFPKDKTPCIAIGKGHDQLSPGTLCMGNCTARHRNVGIFVLGCPPVASEILHAISGQDQNDEHDAHSDAGKPWNRK